MQWRSRQPTGVIHSPGKIECDCCVECIYVTEDVVILATLKQACDQSLTAAGGAEKKLGESEVVRGNGAKMWASPFFSSLLFSHTRLKGVFASYAKTDWIESRLPSS